MNKKSFIYIYNFILLIFKVFFGPLYDFIESSTEEMTGDRMREGGSDRQQVAPGRYSNPGHCYEDKASVQGTPAVDHQNCQLSCHSQLYRCVIMDPIGVLLRPNILCL